jgi:hypothetical protein
LSTRPLLAAALVLVGAAAFAPSASAERILLKNGHEIKDCWILEESKHELVVAVIRRGNIGKIILDPINVDEIDRTREQTLEQALAKARAALEAEERRLAAERAAAAAAAATMTATTEEGAAEGESEAAKKMRAKKSADLVGPTTPEEQARIDAAIKGIGDTRNVGGAAGRREQALRDLVAIGPKALDALSDSLEDDVSYRRMNSARAIADIAAQDRRLQLYADSIPKLIKLLYDPQIWVRVAANRALESVSGQSMNFPEPKGEEPSPEELAAIDKWGKWWDATKQLLPVTQ